VKEHAELAWIFNCITPLPMLLNAHAYKDAVTKGYKDATAGLFTYPILMAADILIYNPDHVPVGKDQKQHVEIARDIASKFNYTFGDVFKIPEPYIPEHTAVIMGTDGENKMSKSYGNVINFFADEKTLKKQVMGIKTDSTPLEDPKDPEKDHIFSFYKFISTADEQKELAEKYRAGGFGYGEAKKMLLNKLLEYFGQFREKRNELINNPDFVRDVLRDGAVKAQKVTSSVMDVVREKTGLKI
jgi:tryptophanyl-tRNA synthetase